MPPLLHLALAQRTPRMGDYTGNLARLGELFARVDVLDPRPTVLQLPETALTGYFLEGGVRDVAVTAGTFADDLQRTYGERAQPLDVVAGFYEVWQSTLYNSAMYVTLGSEGPIIRHVHRKTFLPTYGLFDEERFVERGFDVRAFDTSWGRAAILVCEDAWHSLTPAIAALDGAQVIFLCAAAPARGTWPREDCVSRPASVERWERLVRDIAEEHGVFVALTGLAGTEGGKAFNGSSFVAGPAGDVRVRAPVFGEALLPATCDLSDIARARADVPLLSDLRTNLPSLRAALDRVGTHAPAAPYDVATAPATCVPRDASAGGPPPLTIDPALTEQWLVHFIRDELARRGFTKALVGLSGGVDSAVTAYLATRALGAANVTGVRMPYRTSSPESLAHAELVIDALGIPSRTVDISPAVDGYLATQPDADPARRGNVMARMRMIVLFDLSARDSALPLGTGNKTERLFGYFTWHADDSPPINPLGDLYKSQVWSLARHLGVPSVIVEKPASADLISGQTDEGDFGISYARADEILNWLLAGYTPSELLARGFDPADVDLVRRRLAGTHWKRRLPTVAMLSPTAINESYLRPVDY
ncbi:MAG TPA: NAD+ synthase [Gemmatimonadaceae bacterium]|jgi:NAD+ synthase (glutamine-hydrolysing)|nr:NAD+ synthase [Gemmatimonadaceae bacterium]